MTACRTTKQGSENEKDFSGFLGDYSNIQKGQSGEANYLWMVSGENLPNTQTSFVFRTRMDCEPPHICSSCVT